MIIAGPVLKLKDGRELKGVDLRRDGDLYILEIAGGAVIPVPSGVVKEVEWIEEGGTEESGSQSVANRVTGKTEAEQQEAEQREAARESEMKEWDAKQKADEELVAQRKEEEERAKQASYYNSYNQVSVYGGGGQVLAGSDVRPPTTAEQLAVFGEPAKFPQDIVHFDLDGPSYWIMDPAEANGSPSHFTPPPRDSTWVPTDGFAGSRK